MNNIDIIDQTTINVKNVIKSKMSVKKIIGYIALYSFLIILAIIFLFPYVFMINRGLMSNKWILDTKMHYFSDGLFFKNYVLAFSDGGYGLPFLYSALVCIVVSISTPFATLIASYAFSKLDFLGKKFIFGFMMMTSLIPGIVTQVPLFVLYTNMGLTNTLYPLFLPGLFFSGAMNVFLMRQFMINVPKELEESAVIDGAGAVRRCLSICAPLCKAMLIYLAVNAFIGAWGDYYTPSIYNTNENAPATIAYALYAMTSKETNSTHPEWIFAAATIMSLVPTILFAVFQKYLIEGIATAGVKG